ncbi:T9SS type A sorting domain-containing protein [bacterium]|nr:T9SS type A sorting domain-containing protein [bacterium]
MLDIAFTQAENPNMFGFAYATNDGAGNFTLRPKYSQPFYMGGIAAGDLNGDELDDIVVGFHEPAGEDNLRIYFAREEGGFHAPVIYGDLGHTFKIVAEDFDADGDIDLAVSDLYGFELTILHNDGLGDFGEWEIHATDGGSYDIVAADMNDDGALDLVVSNFAHGLVQIFHNAHPTGIPDDQVTSASKILGVYPNPFNPTGVIRYQLTEAAWVDVEIYDSLGRMIKTLDSQFMNEGIHESSWDGRGDRGELYPSGVYLVQVSSGSWKTGAKLVLMK